MSSKSLSEIVGISARHTQRGNVSGYVVEVRHSGLNEIRTLGDRDHDTALRKAQALCAKWDEKWARIEQQSSVQLRKQTDKEQAESRTAIAEQELTAARTLLLSAIGHSGPLNWASLEDKRQFKFDATFSYPLVDFGKQGAPLGVKRIDIPPAPGPKDAQFDPAFTWIDRLWGASRRRKEEAAIERFDNAHRKWRGERDAAADLHAQGERQLLEAATLFNEQEAQFVSAQLASNLKVANAQSSYEAKNPEAIVRYCELILSRSKYPTFVEPQFDVSYNSATQIAVIECELPDKESIPTLMKVTYVVASREFREKHISENDRDKLFDLVLYQIALRTIYEIFESDAATAIAAVVFNGWVDALSPATGKRVHGCLLSIQAGKGEIDAIDLSKVDPKACFRQLKGVAAARLSGMTPVRPILQMQTKDPRFIEGHEVASVLDEGYNLATMAWEEFEHLVRQLFEEEFARGGAEVHVTRTSSDGGVDAVILDPDPIHGGKIVIQAKRYTNTVGLSAVRDLYGTVINEGANRGILVTTADYGPDAYEFVKGKPLSLLSGANLLHLLASHGHKARIDLKEAKIINQLARQESV